MAVSDSLVGRIVSFVSNDTTYIGIGTGEAPGSSETTLPSETQRKAVTKFIDENTVVVEGFWDENEANGATYTNAGVFGDGATAAIGTGSLNAGGAINIPKTNTQSMTVSVEITVESI